MKIYDIVDLAPMTEFNISHTRLKIYLWLGAKKREKKNQQHMGVVFEFIMLKMTFLMMKLDHQSISWELEPNPSITWRAAGCAGA